MLPIRLNYVAAGGDRPTYCIVNAEAISLMVPATYVVPNPATATPVYRDGTKIYFIGEPDLVAFVSEAQDTVIQMIIEAKQLQRRNT